MILVQIAAGFILLLGGAEILVRGAVALSRRAGVSPAVIGMTVVAFGTSAPEFVVCLQAALSGAPGITLGNAIGSNIANVLLIMGVSALIMPIAVGAGVLIKDAAVVLVGSLVFALFVMLGDLERQSGLALFLLFVAFLLYSYWRETKGKDAMAQVHIAEVEEVQDVPKSMWVASLTVITGLGGVIYGADLLVDGGVEIARAFGVSEEVIGLTIIAIGTSLPELAASAVAAYRGHSDVALGNILGSNLFNILGVVGIVALITPLSVADQIREFDLWIMLASTAVLLPFMIGRIDFSRLVGAAFVAVYTAYIGIQVVGVPRVLGLLG